MAQVSFCKNPTKYYLVGAHYDSVSGTVGADDNASAVAVQLETARHLMMLKDHHELNLAVKFVSFPLEEPPTFGTRHMGSSVYAHNAWKSKEQIDGMICLEMVGYTVITSYSIHYTKLYEKRIVLASLIMTGITDHLQADHAVDLFL